MSHSSFTTVLQEMYDNQKHCNVKFICPDPTNTSGKSSIEAHQLILSMNSDVFETMFFGPVQAKEELHLGIEIPDIHISIFKMMIGFMYDKKVKTENVQMACDFYYAVHKYNYKDGIKFISKHLLKQIKPENSILIYETAEKFNNNELVAACLDVFAKHTTEIITNAPFFNADVTTIAKIFELETLNISSEIDLVKALERYIEHNSWDHEEIRKLRPAVNAIRFLTLSYRDLSQLVKQSQLLKPDEILDIIASLPPKKDLSKIPKGLSVRTEKRHFTNLHQNMIRSLSNVFSGKICCYCAELGAQSTRHAFWNCELVDSSTKTSITAVFNKYNHVSLMEYDPVDLKYVYAIYKRWKFVD